MDAEKRWTLWEILDGKADRKGNRLKDLGRERKGIRSLPEEIPSLPRFMVYIYIVGVRKTQRKGKRNDDVKQNEKDRSSEDRSEDGQDGESECSSEVKDGVPDRQDGFNQDWKVTMIRTQHLVPMNLAQMMRNHKVTIADLARKTQITQKRIREIRNSPKVSYHTFIDFRQAVTGQKPSKADMAFFHELSARGIL